MTKKILIAIVVLLVVIQFWPVSLPEVSNNNPNDLIANNEIAADIQSILKTSCYDCHSNETVYPWYSYVAPVSFLVVRDINEGREHLNFSEWNSLSKLDMAEALDELSEEVEEGEMPMAIYLPMHPEASLSDQDKEKLATWAENFAEALFE